MPHNYCHNCGVMSALPDRVWCAFCRTFFTDHARMPARADAPAPMTTLARLYSELGWEYKHAFG